MRNGVYPEPSNIIMSYNMSLTLYWDRPATVSTAIFNGYKFLGFLSRNTPEITILGHPCK